MSKLLNADYAIVADAKLTGYLLNVSHPSGGPKACFLLRFGFALDRPDAVRSALVSHDRTHEIAASQDTDFGRIFDIDGPLPTPDGRNPIVRTVWMLDSGATAPRLLTMVPRQRRKGGPPK